MKTGNIEIPYNSRGIILVTNFLILFSFAGYSQTDEITSISDTTGKEGDKSRSILYTGGGYGSNMIYLGSSISGSKPYKYYFLSCNITKSLSISASGFHISDLSPIFSYYNFSLNYSRVFNSWFDISSGVCRYQVNSSLPDTFMTSFNYGDFTAGFDWTILYTQLSAGVFLTGKPQVYFQLKNSRYFNILSFSGGKTSISVNPYVSALLGNLITAETYSGEYVVTTTHEYINPAAPSAVTGKTSPGYGSGGGYGSGYGGGTGQSTSSGTTTTTTTTVTTTTSVPYTETFYKKNFGLIDAEIGLPVSFNTERFIFEAELNYVLPAYNYPGFRFKDGVVFMISGIIKIF